MCNSVKPNLESIYKIMQDIFEKEKNKNQSFLICLLKIIFCNRFPTVFIK